MKRALIVFCACVIATTLISQATLPFAESFENGSFNLNHWTIQPSLQGEDGVIEVHYGSGISGSFGVRLGKFQNGTGLATNALDLHLNLAGESDVELTFWIADYYDENHIDDGLYFSDNGGATFEKVWTSFQKNGVKVPMGSTLR